MEYYVQGLGFHTGFLSIQDGKRVWGMNRQLFNDDEIAELIKSIPKYVAYRVLTINHNVVHINA